VFFVPWQEGNQFFLLSQISVFSRRSSSFVEVGINPIFPWLASEKIFAQQMSIYPFPFSRSSGRAELLLVIVILPWTNPRFLIYKKSTPARPSQ